MELIRTIFDSHYKKYGYPRITIELNNRGIKINEKRVARLMRLHHIRAIPRKTKYNSYRGEVGSKAPNIIQRHFDVGEPYKVFGTDVTQFRIGEDKLYLSPIIDFHTREIVAYDMSIHPNMRQIMNMMHQLENKYGEYLTDSIIHSDHSTSTAPSGLNFLRRRHACGFPLAGSTGSSSSQTTGCQSVTAQ